MRMRRGFDTKEDDGEANRALMSMRSTVALSVVVAATIGR
jgi:hypothetical protein